MAKGNRGGRRASTPIATAVSMGAGSNAPISVSAFTDNDAQLLADDMDDIYTDPDFVDARKLYISDSDPNGDGFSHSQNLNYKLDNGLPLNVNEQFIDDNIQAGMHSIGKDSTLFRYAHDDILKSLGISDYSKMTDAQLQKALVGTTFKTTSYMSTTYDSKKSPFAPGKPNGNGREVVMNVNVGKNTQMFFGASKQSEVVLNKGTEFKVTGIHFDGTMAYPRTKMSGRPRVVLDIETV